MTAVVAPGVRDRYRRLGIRKNPFKGRYRTIVTADTGFASEANMEYLYQNRLDAYIPVNQFRQRDPQFQEQKAHYGKRKRPDTRKTPATLPASELQFEPGSKTCICPAGESLSLRSERVDHIGNRKLFFEGKLSQCRDCEINAQCMRKPSAAGHRKGKGRQVSFIIEKRQSGAPFTDWMKTRIDSEKGKHIYAHRMSAVEPVFGNIGTNKRLSRFGLRTKDKVQAQWRLYSLVHNIEKIANYGTIPV